MHRGPLCRGIPIASKFSGRRRSTSRRVGVSLVDGGVIYGFISFFVRYGL